MGITQGNNLNNRIEWES